MREFPATCSGFMILLRFSILLLIITTPHPKTENDVSDVSAFNTKSLSEDLQTPESNVAVKVSNVFHITPSSLPDITAFEETADVATIQDDSSVVNNDNLQSVGVVAENGCHSPIAPLESQSNDLRVDGVAVNLAETQTDLNSTVKSCSLSKVRDEVTPSKRPTTNGSVDEGLASSKVK